jgi:hypothetical protein
MVQILKLDPLEYSEAILDGPEFREKLRKHEKHIQDTNKNLKVLLKKIEDVIVASESVRNAQDSFSVCLRDFQLGFIMGNTSDEESEIVESLDWIFYLFQDIKDYSSSMITAGHNVIKELDGFRKQRLEQFKEKKKEYEKQTVKYCSNLEKQLQTSLVSMNNSSSQQNVNYSSLKKDLNNSGSNFNFNINGISREKYSNSGSLDDENQQQIQPKDCFDRAIKEENQLFYVKCLDYVYNIQEFEYDWFSYFSGNVILILRFIFRYEHFVVF